MKDKLRPGERVFSIAILGFSGWLLYQSLLMFQKAPSLSGYGAMPLMLSIIMLLCMVKVIVLEDRTKEKEAPVSSAVEAVKSAASFLLPKDVLVFIVMMIVYCAALQLGLGFMISTSVFLFLSMCYLIPKAYAKNAVFSVVLMVFIYVVFKMIFKVTLP